MDEGGMTRAKIAISDENKIKVLEGMENEAKMGWKAWA